jgi:1-acyl-sn-glycerol-3-phosphate acyltransferase
LRDYKKRPPGFRRSFLLLPGMLYQLVKILMSTATGIFYKERCISGMQNIPAKGPALLIANHPGSLMDAALLGLSLKRPLHFFARGDIFRHPLARRVLKALHMHPVFHHQEGRHTLGANDHSFEIAIELLKAGELVLFFPEGSSHIDYSLLPFKKGSFRLALQTAEKSGHSLPIVPIGFHYGHPTKPFYKVWINFGRPIDAKEFLSIYLHHPAKAVKQLCDQSYQAIQDLTVTVPADTAAYLFSSVEIFRGEDEYRSMSNLAQWNAEKKISQAIQAAQLQEKVRDYTISRDNSEIREEWIASVGNNGAAGLPDWLVKILILPGKLLNGLPILLAQWIADTKVTRIDFYAWILVAGGAVLSACWQILVFVAIWIAISLPAAIVALAACWVTGWIWAKLEPISRVNAQKRKGKKYPDQR